MSLSGVGRCVHCADRIQCKNTRSTKLQMGKSSHPSWIWVCLVGCRFCDRRRCTDKPVRIIVWGFYLAHIMSWMHRKSPFNKTCARIRDHAPLHRTMAGCMSHTHAREPFIQVLARTRRLSPNGKRVIVFFFVAGYCYFFFDISDKFNKIYIWIISI